MIIIHSNDGNRGVTEHRLLLTRMETCVDTGDILVTDSRIGTGNTGYIWYGHNNIIYKAS